MDLDDTSRCPVAHECEVCDGALGALLLVQTYETQVGVYCATICETCDEAGRTPGPLSAVTAVDRVMRHCEHLGIDADQMAAAMAEED